MRQFGALTITTPTDREVQITREFNAPRHLVFRAMTEPALVKRWLTGPPGWSMPVCEIDLRVGGAYRYLWRKEGGVEMGMRGEFREITPPERLVATELFDDPWYPGGALDTTVLTNRGGMTLMTLTVCYESKETRDAVLKTPMAEGMSYGYEQLEALLKELAVPAR